MKKHFLLMIVFVLFQLTADAQSKDDQQIRAILQKQTIEWNKGNIEAYMAAGYWQDDSLVFIGKNGPKYSYAATLANYKKSYPDTASMGKLAFEVISLQPISQEYYYAIGKWILKRSKGDLAGSWTLLFRKIKGQWKIVVDHSS